MESDPALHAKNYDVKCLRCGAMNIPDNHICGACGASLPLVYDRDGNYMLGPRDPNLALRPARAPARPLVSPARAGWILRVGIILFAVAAAFVIMHRK
jgi:hypothetical protein